MDDPFTAFVSQRPELADVVTSKKSVEMIEYLSKNARTMEEICLTFGISASVAMEILQELIKDMLVETVKIRGNILYKLSMLGEEFLSLYHEFRKGYSLE